MGPIQLSPLSAAVPLQTCSSAPWPHTPLVPIKLWSLSMTKTMSSFPSCFIFLTCSWVRRTGVLRCPSEGGCAFPHHEDGIAPESGFPHAFFSPSCIQHLCVSSQDSGAGKPSKDRGISERSHPWWWKWDGEKRLGRTWVVHRGPQAWGAEVLAVRVQGRARRWGAVAMCAAVSLLCFPYFGKESYRGASRPTGQNMTASREEPQE